MRVGSRAWTPGTATPGRGRQRKRCPRGGRALLGVTEPGTAPGGARPVDVLAASPRHTGPTPLGPSAGPGKGKAGRASSSAQTLSALRHLSLVISNIRRHNSTAPRLPVPSRGLHTSSNRINRGQSRQQRRPVGDAYGFIVTSCSETGPCARGARPQLHGGCLCHHGAGVAAGRSSLFKRPANVDRFQRWLVLGSSSARLPPPWGRSRTRAERARRRERRAPTASGVVPEPPAGTRPEPAGRSIWGFGPSSPPQPLHLLRP